MNTDMDGIKKTALLLSGQDWKIVDLLLSHLDPDTAKSVRREMMSIGYVSETESRRLASEFLKAAGKTEPTTVVEHHIPRPTNGFYGPPKPKTSTPNPEPMRFPAEAFEPRSRKPFDFLRTQTPDNIAREIESEHPQTIAIVLAHLPRSLSMKVLDVFSESLQIDVRQRLVKLDEFDNETVSEIESILRVRLERQACEISFDDLVRLDDAQLLKIFRSVDSTTAILSLVGANPSLIERVIGRFTPMEEKRMREYLKRLGSINNVDVQNARRDILEYVV